MDPEGDPPLSRILSDLGERLRRFVEEQLGNGELKSQPIPVMRYKVESFEYGPSGLGNFVSVR